MLKNHVGSLFIINLYIHKSDWFSISGEPNKEDKKEKGDKTM